MNGDSEPARSSGRFALALTLGYAVVAIAGILRHEPWRDELQAWMVVTDPDSLAGVWHNMRYEGNPMLWQLLLFGLSRLTPDPRIMQALHVLLAIGFVWVFARFAPFSRLVKVLFPFGYFTLFEYGMISRGYGLGLLLALVACVLWPARSSRFLWIGVVLALLANTSLYGMVIAGGLAAVLALDFLRRRGREDPGGRAGVAAAGLAIAVAGIALSAFQIWPEPDNTFFVPWPRQIFEPARLGFVAGKIFAAYAPVPELTNPHWWNTNAFVGDGGVATWLLPLLVVAAGVVVFRRRPLTLFLYVSGNVVLLGLFYVTLLDSARYYGHFFILWIVCCWIGRYEEAPAGRGRTSWLDRIERPMLVAVLAANLVGGAVAYGKDFTGKFTVSGDVAEYVLSSPYADLPIVGATDYQTSPLSALLRRPLYYPEQREFGSFLIWDADRIDRIDLDDVAAAVRAVLLLRSTDRCLAILSFQPMVEQDGAVIPLENGILGGDVELQLLRSFPPGIVADETYHVYLARRVPGREPAGEPLQVPREGKKTRTR